MGRAGLPACRKRPKNLWLNPDLWVLTSRRRTAGFLGAPSENEGVNTEDIETQVCENIYDWWISGKSYKEWYADKFLQQEIEFE